MTSTLLAAAVVTPVIGSLGDMYGKRRMLLVSVAMLVLGSVVCALSTSLAPMVAGRIMQGLSAGVIALGISIMRDEVSPDRLPSATAMMSASFGNTEVPSLGGFRVVMVRGAGAALVALCVATFLPHRQQPLEENA